MFRYREAAKDFANQALLDRIEPSSCDFTSLIPPMDEQQTAGRGLPGVDVPNAVMLSGPHRLSEVFKARPGRQHLSGPGHRQRFHSMTV